jgi:hypothetical protein
MSATDPEFRPGPGVTLDEIDETLDRIAAKGLAMWALILILRYVICCISSSKGLARTQVTQLKDAIRLDIVDPWGREPRAGQYISVNIPAVSLTSIFQSHPFMIAWWERADNKMCLYCLVQPRRGFTRWLAAQGSLSLATFITGPYGRPSGFKDYGTVLMFATGFGIAAQIPHLKDLFDCYSQAKARTRKIHLVWQTQSTGTPRCNPNRLMLTLQQTTSPGLWNGWTKSWQLIRNL